MIADAVGDPERPQNQRDEDIARKPAETLAFAGVKPGMIVGEFLPGKGYFTRLLSDLVGRNGHVYAVENASWPPPPGHTAPPTDQRQAANVSFSSAVFDAIRFPEPLDLAWITQNYHDLKISKLGAVDTAAFNHSVFVALKPGGIFVVVDHEAPAGTDANAIARLHRIERAQVVREVTAAGFILVDEGNFLRRRDDDHTRPIFDAEVRGRTDQFVLKFVKPHG